MIWLLVALAADPTPVEAEVEEPSPAERIEQRLDEVGETTEARLTEIEEALIAIAERVEAEREPSDTGETAVAEAAEVEEPLGGDGL